MPPARDSLPLVSVIVPAFDAATTLRETLESVRAQTHRGLEILVVDDGSGDLTPAIAEAQARADPRVRLIRQENGGVARARNAALRQSRGAFAAWVDADDLWHPTKIERQLATFSSATETPTLVYTGYRLIDGAGRIIPNFRPLTDVSGFTPCTQIATNFFTNVSSVMVPTELALAAGGHDPALRDAGIEGAEDFLLQLRLASRGPVLCCPAALVGYRMHDHNMSRDHARSARSNFRAIDLVAAENPTIPPWVLRRARARVGGYAFHLLRAGRVREAAALLGTLLRHEPLETIDATARIAAEALFGTADSDPELGRSFAEADPDSAIWEDHGLIGKATLRRLGEADAGCRAAADLAPPVRAAGQHSIVRR